MDPKYACVIFRSLGQSVIDCGWYLIPWGSNETNAFKRLMLRFVGNALGMRVRLTQIPRLLAMFDIDSIGFRRRALTNRFCRRMINQSKDESEMSSKAGLQALITLQDLNLQLSFRYLVSHVAHHPLTEKTNMNIGYTTRHELTRRLKRPVAVGEGLCLALKFAGRNERRLAIRLH